MSTPATSTDNSTSEPPHTHTHDQHHHHHHDHDHDHDHPHHHHSNDHPHTATNTSSTPPTATPSPPTFTHSHDGLAEHSHPMAPGTYSSRTLFTARDFTQRAFTVGIGGPVGSGKCWAAGTKLRLYNGDVKAVETFVGGEELMGDDDRRRIVTPGSVIVGQAPMYRIDPLWEGARPFTVNGAHILVLTVNQKPSVRKADGDSHKLIW